MPDLLDTFITPEQKATVRAPIGEAMTLPRHCFTSDVFFELEVERIFSRHWLALCFAAQLPEPGHLLPLEFAGIPLLLVRAGDGIRVFHNIVPYDGCLAVLEEAGAQDGIITPYHGWRYDLQGKLQATPYWDGQLQADLSALGGRARDLREVPSRLAFGMVFIDLGGQAGAFEDQLAPLQALLAAYHTEGLELGRDEHGAPLVDSEQLATNWKTHYENWALNVLHEAFTHEVYAASPQIPRVDAKGRKTYQTVLDRSLMALAYQEQDFAETYELDELPFPSIGRDAAALPEQSFIGSLFPNVHMAVFPYFIHFIIALPVSAGQTRTLRAQFYAADAAVDPAYLEARLELQAEFQQAGQEDGRITEAVQRARRSPAYTQQFYSPFWDQMHYRFSNQVLDALEQGGTRLSW